jgi:hypothetical protein
MTYRIWRVHPRSTRTERKRLNADVYSLYVFAVCMLLHRRFVQHVPSQLIAVLDGHVAFCNLQMTAHIQGEQLVEVCVRRAQSVDYAHLQVTTSNEQLHRHTPVYSNVQFSLGFVVSARSLRGRACLRVCRLRINRSTFTHC